MMYRLLPAEEFDRLPPDLRDANPDGCYIAVAEVDDRVVGVLGFSLQPHLDGFWIDPPERGKVDWRRLWAVLEGKLTQYPGLRLYAAPTFKNGEKMLKIVGFDYPTQRVMVKEV